MITRMRLSPIVKGRQRLGGQMQEPRNDNRTLLSRLWLVAFTLWFLSGCADIRIIGAYDKQIDDGVTALQMRTESHLLKLTSGPGSNVSPYSENENFYGEAKVAISSLRVRADATSRNSLTVRQLDTLQTNLDLFQEMHRQGLSKAEIPDLRGGFNSHFTAILTFELAKRRTQTPNEESALEPATVRDTGTKPGGAKK